MARVYKWRDGKLVECGLVEAMHSFWVSGVPGAWKNFRGEHGHETEERQLELIAELNERNRRCFAPEGQELP